MATDKKSFLIYCDVIHSIEHLTNEEKGRLFQHLLEYVNDMNPTLEDRILIGSWKPIEQQLKRDLVKYESIRERNSKNGSLGGRPKNPNKPTGFSGNPTEPKKADTDTVIDTVIDTDKVTVIEKESKEADFKKSLLTFQDKYDVKLLEAFYLYWSESNPNGKKMKFEMQKTFDISRRLITWKKNEKNFSGAKSSGKMTVSDRQQANREIMHKLLNK
jgi:hypothetical protein